MKLLSRFFRRSVGSVGSVGSVDAVVSRRLEEGVESAGYWVGRMPREAARLVGRGRLYTFAAAVLSLVTGLLAWPVIGGLSQLAAQVFICVLSGVAALVVVVPHATGLSDRGDESIRLSGAYGVVYRELLEARGRLAAGSLEDPSHVADVIRQFEHVQERRDALALPAGEGHLEGVSAAGLGRERWGRAGVGGGRQVAGPLLPAARVRSRAGRSGGADDEVVLGAVVCVLASGRERGRVALGARVSSFTVHRLLRRWFRAGGRGVFSSGGAGRLRGLGSAGFRSRLRFGVPVGRGVGERVVVSPADRDGSGGAVQLLRDAAGTPLVLGVRAGDSRDARR